MAKRTGQQAVREPLVAIFAHERRIFMRRDLAIKTLDVVTSQCCTTWGKMAWKELRRELEDGVQKQSSEAPNQQIKPKMPSLDNAIKYGEKIGISEALVVVFMDWLASHFGR
jgi:hypothetical protein